MINDLADESQLLHNVASSTLLLTLDLFESMNIVKTKAGAVALEDQTRAYFVQCVGAALGEEVMKGTLRNSSPRVILDAFDDAIERAALHTIATRAKDLTGLGIPQGLAAHCVRTFLALSGKDRAVEGALRDFDE